MDTGARAIDLTLVELSQRLAEEGIQIKVSALWLQLNEWELSFKKTPVRRSNFHGNGNGPRFPSCSMAIIINAAGCGSTLKAYGHLLKDDPKWRDRAERFSESVCDLSEFLLTKIRGTGSSTLNFQPSTKRTTYHDACHLAHAQGITNQPRELVKMIAGENFVELPESDVCCGSAGSYNLTEPEMAERLQKRKVENILKTGAEVVVTTNPGCILQIAAGLKKTHGKQIEVVHLADFLNFSSRTR